jgi:beta-glucosidase
MAEQRPFKPLVESSSLSTLTRVPIVGLFYTRYEYSDLVVETPSLTAGGTLKVCLTLTNAGSRDGVEVIQLYVRDQVATITRPVKELKGFQRIELKAGESRHVQFDVPVNDLGFTGLDDDYMVEPGKFTLWVGPDSTNGLQGEFFVHP